MISRKTVLATIILSILLTLAALKIHSQSVPEISINGGKTYAYIPEAVITLNPGDARRMIVWDGDDSPGAPAFVSGVTTFLLNFEDASTTTEQPLAIDASNNYIAPVYAEGSTHYADGSFGNGLYMERGKENVLPYSDIETATSGIGNLFNCGYTCPPYLPSDFLSLATDEVASGSHAQRFHMDDPKISYSSGLLTKDSYLPEIVENGIYTFSAYLKSSEFSPRTFGYRPGVMLSFRNKSVWPPLQFNWQTFSVGTTDYERKVFTFKLESFMDGADETSENWKYILPVVYSGGCNSTTNEHSLHEDYFNPCGVEGENDLYVDAFQFEEGNLTSYIPTGSSPESRATDILAYTAPSDISDPPSTGSEGTIEFWVQPLWDGDERLLHIKCCEMSGQYATQEYSWWDGEERPAPLSGTEDEYGVTRYLFDSGLFKIYKGDDDHLYVKNGTNNPIDCDKPDVTREDWANFTLTWHDSGAATDEIKIYLDGNKLDCTGGFDSDLDEPAATIFIGSDHNGDYQADAVFDAVRISNTAFSEEDVEARYARGSIWQPVEERVDWVLSDDPADEAIYEVKAMFDNSTVEYSAQIEYSQQNAVLFKANISDTIYPWTTPDPADIYEPGQTITAETPANRIATVVIGVHSRQDPNLGPDLPVKIALESSSSSYPDYLVGDLGSIPLESVEVRAVKSLPGGGPEWRVWYPPPSEYVECDGMSAQLQDDVWCSSEMLVHRSDFPWENYYGLEYGDETDVNHDGYVDLPIDDPFAGATSESEYGYESNSATVLFNHDKTKEIVITIEVPENTPSGTYGGSLVFSSGGYPFLTVPFQLEVLPFRLHETMRTITTMAPVLLADVSPGVYKARRDEQELFTADLLINDLLYHGMNIIPINDSSNANESYDSDIGENENYPEYAGMSDPQILMTMAKEIGAKNVLIFSGNNQTDYNLNFSESNWDWIENLFPGQPHYSYIYSVDNEPYEANSYNALALALENPYGPHRCSSATPSPTCTEKRFYNVAWVISGYYEGFVSWLEANSDTGDTCESYVMNSTALQPCDLDVAAVSMDNGWNDGPGASYSGGTFTSQLEMMDAQDNFPGDIAHREKYPGIFVDASLGATDEMTSGSLFYYWQSYTGHTSKNRFLTGYFLNQSHFKGVFPFHYSMGVYGTNPLYDSWPVYSFQNAVQWQLVYPTLWQIPGGESHTGIVSTTLWENFREGVDDLRTVETFNFWKKKMDEEYVEHVDLAQAASSLATAEENLEDDLKPFNWTVTKDNFTWNVVDSSDYEKPREDVETALSEVLTDPSTKVYFNAMDDSTPEYNGGSVMIIGIDLITPETEILPELNGADIATPELEAIGRTGLIIRVNGALLVPPIKASGAASYGVDNSGNGINEMAVGFNIDTSREDLPDLNEGINTVAIWAAVADGREFVVENFVFEYVPPEGCNISPRGGTDGIKNYGLLMGLVGCGLLILRSSHRRRKSKS